MSCHNHNLIPRYRHSLKSYRDLKNSLDTYKEEGRKEGIRRVAISAIKKGFDDITIQEITNLSFAEIAQIRQVYML